MVVQTTVYLLVLAVAVGVEQAAAAVRVPMVGLEETTALVVVVVVVVNILLTVVLVEMACKASLL